MQLKVGLNVYWVNFLSLFCIFFYKYFVSSGNLSLATGKRSSILIL